MLRRRSVRCPLLVVQSNCQVSVFQFSQRENTMTIAYRDQCFVAILAKPVFVEGRIRFARKNAETDSFEDSITTMRETFPEFSLSLTNKLENLFLIV